MKTWTIFSIIFAKILSLSMAHFDFYTDSTEIEKTNRKRIFYIQDGIVNQFSMSRQNQELSPELNELIFRWRAFSPKRNITYSVNLVYTPGISMDRPKLNISSTGVVPVMDTPFSIKLVCTGLKRSFADFLIQIKFSSSDIGLDPILLNFKRRKLCLKNISKFAGVSDTTSAAIALGSAAGAILVFFLLMGFMYAMRNKRHPHIPKNSLAQLDYVSKCRRETLKGNQSRRKQSFATFSNFTTAHLDTNIPGHSHPDRRRKAMSLNYRTNYGFSTDESRHNLLYSSSSPSTGTSTTTDTNRIRADNLPPSRSLVIEGGVLKLTGDASNVRKPPHLSSRPVDTPPMLVPTQSVQPSAHMIPQSTLLSSSSSSLSDFQGGESSQPDSFLIGESLGIRVSDENIYRIPDKSLDGNEDESDIENRLYSHLMPRNIKRARRSSQTSGESPSVLV